MTRRQLPPAARLEALLARLEALGADREPLELLRDFRAARKVDRVSLDLLDDLAEMIAGMLPKPKGRRQTRTGRLAAIIVEHYAAHNIPVGESIADSVKQFALSDKEAKSLDVTVDNLLRERGLLPTPLDKEIEKLSRRVRLSYRSEWEPPDEPEKK